MGRTAIGRRSIKVASFILGLTLNALILALIAHFGAPAIQQVTASPVIIPLDLFSPSAPKLVHPIRPKFAGSAARLAPNVQTIAPDQPDDAPPVVQAIVPPGPAATAAVTDDVDRSKVTAALRGLTGCSMISGPDDETTRERCRAAFTRADVDQVTIDSVPSEKRVGYESASARAAYRRNVTTEGLIEKVGQGGIAHDRGRNINVRYTCFMKIGPNAVYKMHCPGVM